MSAQSTDPGHPAGTPAQTAGAEIPDFLVAVVEAVQATGRDVTVDSTLETIHVDSPDPLVGTVLGVVRPTSASVSLYAVHPRPVPGEAWDAVGELTVRGTNDLFDTTLELDLGTGVLAARSSVSLGLLAERETPALVLAALLLAALEAVETTAARYHDAVEDVIEGRATPQAAAADVRGADLRALEARLADSEGTTAG